MSFLLREQFMSTPFTADEVEWEECECLLCGGSRWEPLVEAPDRTAKMAGKWFLVVQCQECGLCFTNPRPTQRSMTHFYREEYCAYRSVTDLDRRLRTWVRKLGRPFSNRASCRKVMPVHGRGRLLDFGCGSGSFLWRMHQQGWEVIGVDSSESAVQRVRLEFGLPAMVGSLPHEYLKPGTFDTITMWQSLEHVHQPLEVLRAARNLLAPGGKLVLAVPNIDSLPFRWFGQAWNALDLPRHLTHFAPWTLTLLLHRAGFHPGPVRMIRRSGWLRNSVDLACCLHPTVPRWMRWLKKRPIASLASWYSLLTRQSDCMMVTASVDG